MKIKYIILPIALLLSIGSVMAQEIRILTDTIDTSKIELDEITVKSPKEYSNKKEVPASISIISSQKIEYNEVQSLSDISSMAPNLFVLDYGSKLQSPVFIRGIGSKLGSPSVGLYVDNIPYYEKSTFGFDFFDIDRIEVLRGPQGTLYGRNTMGGIINIYTKSPSHYDGTKISVTGGNYNYLRANINHYNKINDKISFSLGGNFLMRDGYFVNAYNDEPVDNIKSGSGRGRLVWDMSDRLSMEFIASFELSKQYGFPYAVHNDESGQTEEINYNQDSHYEQDVLSGGLSLKYRHDVFDLISTTSYQFNDGEMAVDQDFTSDSILFLVTADKRNMMSQEVMLKSTTHSRYNWLLGAYGFYQSSKQPTIVNLYGAPPFVPAIMQDVFNNFESFGFALFHQSTLNDILIKNLSLDAGIRLDIENDALDHTLDLTVNDIPMPGIDTTFQEGFMEILPKVALKYKVGQHSNIYATATKGYKAGGYNTNVTEIDKDNIYYGPENSWNYELGAKVSLAGNRLHIDAALFYIDWTKQQIDVPASLGQGMMKTNAGKSISKGGELFVRALPATNWIATISYGYTHAKFVEYIAGENLNYNDNFIPYVPRYVVNGSLSKVFVFNNGSVLDKLIANINYRGAGKFFWNVENTASQGYYGLLDAKLSFIKNRLQLDIWGKNLSNADYNSYWFEIEDVSYIQDGRPLTFGANLLVKF